LFDKEEEERLKVEEEIRDRGIEEKREGERRRREERD
jgi:hypothetical protein